MSRLVHPIQLFEIILLLGLSAAGLALFERLKLPAIAGFLVVGAFAGPGVLGLVLEPDRVRALAEIGVIFLLFEIGLELPVGRARRFWRNAILAGGLQVGITLAVVFGVARLFGMEAGPAFVIGGMVTMSSTALVLRLLFDQAQSSSPHGQFATSILIFQDLSIVPLLLVVPLIASENQNSWTDIALLVARALGALAIVVFVVQIAVPRAINRIARLGSPDLFSLLTLLIVLGSAFLAEELGLTLAVGAFLAGVAASSSPYAEKLFSEIIPLRGVALGIFFTAVGMLFEPLVVIEQAPVVLAILFATTVVKGSIIAGISGLIAGNGLRIGILSGVILAQCGEFSFVLAEVAAKAGLLDESLYQAALAASIISLLATPFFLRLAPALSDSIAERFGRWNPTSAEDVRLPSGHDRSSDAGRIVIIGFGPAGRTLAQLLKSLRRPYAIVDANANAVTEAQSRGEPIVFGDAARPSFLERFGIADARLVAVAISDPVATRRVVARIRALAPDITILARARYVHEVDRLEAAGASIVVAEEIEGSIELVRQTLEVIDYHPGAIRNFTDALRDEDYGVIRSSPELGIDPWLVEILQEEEHEWIVVPEEFRGGRSLAELNVRAITGASIVAVDRMGSIDTVPAPAFNLRSGDRILALGAPSALTSLEQLLAREFDQ
jgi:CPA2 family monovalent cation:H+ antiporter-2